MALGSAPAASTVIFDYGEVISLPQPSWARVEMERLAGAPVADFWAAYWARRPAFDAGQPVLEFWHHVLRDAGVTWDPDADPGRVQALWATDVGSWLHVSSSTASIVRRLARGGVRLALLSNAPHDVAGALRHSPLMSQFEHLFFSCDLGACKPDPEVYTRVLAALGADPGDTVFVDDREENVLAAKRLGIVAHHYSDTDELASFLADRVLAF